MFTTTRKTTESVIKVTITPPPLCDDYRSKIRTPIPFLNHMIEHIAWRTRLNIEIDVQLSDIYLSHVVCEDLGQTFGKTLNKTLNNCGYGVGVGIIDEARASCAISFEGRSGFFFDNHVDMTEMVEGMSTEDLFVFIDGVAQGANCTIQLDIVRGQNMHHIWEACFRAVGIAVNNAMNMNEFTSGVAGSIDFS